MRDKPRGFFKSLIFSTWKTLVSSIEKKTKKLVYIWRDTRAKQKALFLDALLL